MEKDWPPLIKCAQYKCGMLHPFLEKLDWEDGDQETTFYYSDDDGLGGRRKLEFKPRTIKTFLDQVRNSRGYDVDIRPPSFMNSPFWPVERGTYEAVVSKSIELALDYITTKTGKVYEHVKSLKAVFSPNRVLLLTFVAKEVASDAEEQTFLTSVFAPPHNLDEESELLECFLKPDVPAPLM